MEIQATSFAFEPLRKERDKERKRTDEFHFGVVKQHNHLKEREKKKEILISLSLKGHEQQEMKFLISSWMIKRKKADIACFREGETSKTEYKSRQSVVG